MSILTASPSSNNKPNPSWNDQVEIARGRGRSGTMKPNDAVLHRSSRKTPGDGGRHRMNREPARSMGCTHERVGCGISNPPTPVKDGRTTAWAKRPNPGTLPRIDIHEAMLSPFADADHARWMVGQLNTRGWAATYQPRNPIWQFESYEEADRFRRDFDEILLQAAPTFVWRIWVFDPDEQAFGCDLVTTTAAIDLETPQDVMGGMK